MPLLSRSTSIIATIAVALLIGCASGSDSSSEVESAEETTEPATPAERNLAEGTAFIEEVATRDGVQSTASGLLYEVIEEGEGDKPGPTSRVTVAYRGTYPDGREFDSSERFSFGLNGVIPGWTEGLQLMSPGAKYKFYIPSDLAYGPGGHPAGIPPNQALVFDVELFEFAD